ncbi:MAG: GNAT family N-acetyltransferase [Chloroflexota bacterium]
MSYRVSPESFSGLQDIWRETRRRLSWPCIFVLPPWLEAWWQHFHTDEEACLLTLRLDDDILGVAPLMTREGQAFFLGSTDVCDYADFITAPGKETEFFRLLLDDLKKRGITRLDLGHVRPDAAVITHLVPLAEELGYPVTSRQEAVTLEMDLPPTWEGYLNVLNRKQRHEVRRKLRRLEEAAEVQYRCSGAEDNLNSRMDTFIRLFALSPEEEKAGFMTPGKEAFFRGVAAAMTAQDMLRLGTMELDGKPSAMVMAFAYRETMYLYNSAYDPAYGHLSVGVLAKVLCIREAIRGGMKMWDFLKGDEIYKTHLGGKTVPLYRCELSIK